MSRRSRSLARAPWLVAVALGVTVGACSADRPAAPRALASASPAPQSLPAPTPTATIPVIAGVSRVCATAMAAFAIDGYLDPVMRACATIEELEAADAHFAIGVNWAAEVKSFCGYGPAPICATLPTPPPTPMPMTAERARDLCDSARPGKVYGVTAAVKPLADPGGPYRVHVLLVELRDLDGKIRMTPNLKDETFYEFEPFVVGESSQVTDEMDLVACVALRATELEFWHLDYAVIVDYPIHASDAILWMATASDGKRLGAPWLRHPPASGSGDNYINWGEDGPGQRAPPETQIVADIETFLGE